MEMTWLEMDRLERILAWRQFYPPGLGLEIQAEDGETKGAGEIHQGGLGLLNPQGEN